MRVVGMVLLCLGITLLFPSGIALIHAEGLGQVIGFLICTALVPVPMIVSGIAIIRRAEDPYAQGLGEGAGDAATALPSEPEPRDTGNPLQDAQARLLRFDLTRLNWIGWLLLLATFGFVAGEAGILVLVVGPGGREGGRLPRVVGLPLLLLAIGFFVALKWLLGVFGLSIYRR